MFSVLFRRCFEKRFGGEGVWLFEAGEEDTNRFCSVEEEEDDTGPLESVCKCKRSGLESIRSTAIDECNGESVEVDLLDWRWSGLCNGVTDGFFSMKSSVTAVAAVVDVEDDRIGDRRGDPAVVGDTFRGGIIGASSD